MLHSICQQIWKTQQWPQDWKQSVFIPIPKKGNAKVCSNYHTTALISHASKVIIKILKGRLQCTWTKNFQPTENFLRQRHTWQVSGTAKGQHKSRVIRGCLVSSRIRKTMGIVSKPLYIIGRVWFPIGVKGNQLEGAGLMNNVTWVRFSKNYPDYCFDNRL